MSFTKTLVLAALLTTSLGFNAQKSEAALALTLPIAAPVATLMVIGGAFALFTVNETTYSFCRSTSGCFYERHQGLIGLVLLDKENNDVKFQKIASEETAKKLGLSKSEVEAYNLELDRINLATSEVQDALSNNTSAEEARNILKSEVSTEAFTAVEKIIKGSFSEK